MRSSRAPSRAGSARRVARAADGLALLEACERGAFPATLYVEGPDEPLKAVFLASLRRAWTAAAGADARPRVLRAAETEVSEILAMLQGGSLFATRELAIVFEVEDLGRGEKRIAALAAGLARPGEGATLVLVESAAETARKSLEPLRAACDALWTALPPDRVARIAWGERRLARDGVSAEPGVVEGIAEACEGDDAAFFNELDKLVTFAGPDARLTRADVEALRKPSLEADLPDYLAAVAAGDPVRAAQRLGRLLASGAGEGTVMFALGNLVGGALGGWTRWRPLAETLRARASARELARALDAVYRAEAAWKGGRGEVVTLLEHTTRVLCTTGAASAGR